MIQDAHSKMVCKTGSSQNQKQHVVGCENMHIEENGRQLTILRKVSVQSELSNQFISTCNGKRQGSKKKPFVRTVWEIKHHDVVS